MNKPAEISNQAWQDLKNKVDTNSQDIGYLKSRTKRHGEKLDTLEDSHLTLPLAIKEAVSEGMAPVLAKVMKHDEMFSELALMKERETRERAERLLDQEADRKKWFYRTIMATVIGGIVGPAITLLIYILVNNYP